MFRITNVPLFLLLLLQSKSPIIHSRAASPLDSGVITTTPVDHGADPSTTPLKLDLFSRIGQSRDEKRSYTENPYAPVFSSATKDTSVEESRLFSTTQPQDKSSFSKIEKAADTIAVTKEENLSSSVKPLLSTVTRRPSRSSERYPSFLKGNTNSNSPHWDSDKWIEIWQRAVHSKSQEKSIGNPEGESPHKDPPIVNTTRPSSSLTQQVKGENSDWNVENWVDLWEKATGGRTSESQKLRSQETSAYTVPTGTFSKPSTFSPKEELYNSHPEWSLDKWVELWGKVDENESKNHSPKSVSLLHDPTVSRGETSADAVTTVKSTLDSTAPSINLKEELSGNHPDWNIDQWVELWENSIKDLQESTARPGKTTTATATHTSPPRSEESAQDEYQNHATKGDSLRPYSRHSPTVSSIETHEDSDATIYPATETTTAPLSLKETITRKHPDGHIEQLVDQWEKAVRDLQEEYSVEKNSIPLKAESTTDRPTKTDVEQSDVAMRRLAEESRPEGTNDIAKEGSRQSDDYQPEKLPNVDELAKEESPLPESESDASTKTETSTKRFSSDSKMFDSGVPNPPAHFQHQPLQLNEETEDPYKQLNGSKTPVKDFSLFGLDHKTAFIVVACCLCVLVAILVTSFVVCICCKKRAKGMSWQTKQLTTMNTDANRFDLQILRPEKKSLDAFVFGRPIATVEETLRNVVVPVDYPELRY